MQYSNLPSKFALIWGVNQTASYIRVIPTTTSDPTAASLSLGFPADTATPVGSGGTPPDVRDENGILNQLSAWAQWFQAGGPIEWDSTFNGNIGGYPKGALISASDFGSFWLNGVDNNNTDPDTGGANWFRITLIGLESAAYTFCTNNAYDYVASVVPGITVGHVAVFSDALGTIEDGGPSFTGGTAAQKNASNNSLPSVASVNGGTTIGHFASFSDGNGTVQDSGSDAASFDPAGSASTAQTNAETFATGAASTAQSNAESFATTAANNAQSAAQTYAAAQASTAQSNAETFATAAVLVETNRAETAEALLAPLNSPAFTSVPTVPTAAPGTNSNQIADTAFVQAAIGLTVRYARVLVTISGSFALDTFNWNTAFPTQCLAATATCETNDTFNPNASGNNFVAIAYNHAGGTTGGNIRIDTEQGGAAHGTVWVNIIGVGN